MKKSPYKILEGAHYGVKGEFPSFKERFAFLTSYADEARMIYEKYKGRRPEEIENEEERIKFEQFNLYQLFESDLILVEIFREKIKKASRIVDSIREAKKQQLSKYKLMKLHLNFALARAEVKKLINSLGPLLELAHRRILKKEKPYYDFLRLLRERTRLEILLEGPLGEAKIAQDVFERLVGAADLKDDRVRKSLINIAQARDYLRDSDLSKILDDPYTLAELNNLSEALGEDLVSYAERLLREKGKSREPSSRSEAERRLEEINSELKLLWSDPLVRYKFYQRFLERLIVQDQMGDPSLEIPSMIRLMNEIYRSERIHSDNPIAAVLIGPPGTGKSLIIEHYLSIHPEHKKRGAPVIIDLSQETTEFILLGGEAIEITDKVATVEALRKLLEEERLLEKLLKEKEESGEINVEEVEALRLRYELLRKHVEDLIHAFMGRFVEARKEVERLMDEKRINDIAREAGAELEKTAGEKGFPSEIIEKIRERIINALVEWEAQELGKIMYGNGWRDGIILKAIIEGRDIIINEFNNFKFTPDALRQLFQTPYGGEWFFAGTGKRYKVYSRFYLTANAGKSEEKYFYDTAQIPAAILSRLPPPIVVDLPPSEEELMIIQAKLSDTNRKFLRNKELEAKLYAIEALKDIELYLNYNERELLVYLFTQILPRLRDLPNAPSLDLRHINRFCRELVNQYTRERTTMSVEEAFIKHFCEPFRYSPESWRSFCDSGIIEEMYKVGLLHQEGRDKYIYKFLIDVMATKRNLRLEGVSEETKRDVLTKLEKELQDYDTKLIETLQQGKEWSEIIKKAQKERRVVLLNPHLKETLPNSFSENSLIPTEKSF